AFFVPASGIEVIPDEIAQLERVKDLSFDAERSVVLSQALPEIMTLPADKPAINTSKVAWTSSRVNDFDIDVYTSQPSILVVSQIDYPGWKARVDRRSVPII